MRRTRGGRTSESASQQVGESASQRVSGPGHRLQGRSPGEADLGREFSECFVRVKGKMGEEGLAE